MDAIRWFRRDAARNAGQKSRSPLFTPGGLALLTVLLALATALVALPLRNARERQMMRAARAEFDEITRAVEEYRGLHYRLPGSIDELSTVGYSASASVVVCRYRHVPDARSFDDHLELAIRHRESGTAVVGRYPSRGVLAEAPAAEACGTASDETGMAER